ncbi:MAG: FtsQ-type POTRA domain-containing protein [Oscillospiraceae bacterium]|nr:FtsQ-type POTRA domain-containing protein [Oscillospiraceae bacterium]
MVGNRDIARERARKARAAKPRTGWDVARERARKAQAVGRPAAARPVRQNPRKYVRRSRFTTNLYYTAAIVVILCTIVGLMFTVFFKIDSVDVTQSENTPYSGEEILAHCPVRKGDNLLLAGMEDAGNQISSALPYIDRCNITRVYPSTLRIEPIPAEIMGYIRLPDGFCVVTSTSGRAVALTSEGEAESITALTGLAARFDGVGQPMEVDSPDDLEIGAKITRALGKYSLRATEIIFDGRHVSFVYDNRIVCKLGLPTDVERKAEYASVILAQGHISVYESGVLDLRNPNKNIIFHPGYLDRDKEQNTE